jgi:hypothetical protein
MPTIEISDTDFQRLQKIAVPLIDTPKTVLTKLLDSYEKANGAQVPNGPARAPVAVEQFGPGNIPPLTHTKLMAAQFDNAAPEKTSWDSLVQLALTRVMEKCKDARELQRLSGANLVGGEKHDDGYKHLASHGFSYQGVSAEDAAKIVVRCAKALGRSAFFEFEWRDKEGAFKPGQRAIVKV